VLPILCGGTGLYLDSLIYEREYMGREPDQMRRRALEEYREKYGNEALWKRLHDMDPAFAETLHVNNYTHIIRGIEIYEDTGKSKLEASHGQKLRYETLFFTPYTDSPDDRKILYDRINARVRDMFSA
jgi:tRNA dimethylallyltransferase